MLVVVISLLCYMYTPRIKTENNNEHQINEVSCFLI